MRFLYFKPDNHTFQNNNINVPLFVIINIIKKVFFLLFFSSENFVVVYKNYLYNFRA